MDIRISEESDNLRLADMTWRGIFMFSIYLNINLDIGCFWYFKSDLKVQFSSHCVGVVECCWCTVQAGSISLLSKFINHSIYHCVITIITTSISQPVDTRHQIYTALLANIYTTITLLLCTRHQLQIFSGSSLLFSAFRCDVW